jgi:hypothetical protein
MAANGNDDDKENKPPPQPPQPAQPTQPVQLPSAGSVFGRGNNRANRDRQWYDLQGNLDWLPAGAKPHRKKRSKKPKKTSKKRKSKKKRTRRRRR